MLVASEQSPSRPKPKQRKPRRVSSAITSGARLFMLGNRNTPWARRYSDLVRLHAQDVGAGVDLSQAQQSLIRRAAAIEVELELMEGKLSMGEAVDLDIFTRSTSHLRRILETLGIERRSRDVTPDVDTYLTIKREVEAEARAAATEHSDEVVES